MKPHLHTERYDDGTLLIAVGYGEEQYGFYVLVDCAARVVSTEKQAKAFLRSCKIDEAHELWTCAVEQLRVVNINRTFFLPMDLTREAAYNILSKEVQERFGGRVHSPSILPRERMPGA